MLIPIARPASGLSPAMWTWMPNRWRLNMKPRMTAKPSPQNIWAGIGPQDPTIAFRIGDSSNSVNWRTSPRLRTCVNPINMKLTPKVVMRDENPSFVTRNPLRSPQAIPVSKEARNAAKKLKFVAGRVIAKASPDKGTIDGKERSISPATVTKTSAKTWWCIKEEIRKLP